MLPLKKYGAGDRGRTGTVLLPSDFESDTSANSITPAYIQQIYYNTKYTRMSRL